MRRFPLILALATILASCSPKSEDVDTPQEKADASGDVEANPASFPDVVARVNGTDISKADLMERVADIDARSGGAIDMTKIGFYRRVLDDLIGAELLFQECAKRDLVLTDEEVETQVNALKSRMPDPASFDQALASEGLTLDKLREQIHHDMSIQKLIDADVAPDITVTEDQKRKYYDDNPELMRQPDRLRVSHILKRVAPDATPEEKEAARAEIQALLEQARSGADFAALAREHSEDPGSAANGGQLVVARGETVPPFEEAAFALSPGEISPVVETQFGFHIIKLAEKIEGQTVPYNQVAARIEQFLKQQALQDAVKREVDALRAKSDVEILLEG